MPRCFAEFTLSEANGLSMTVFVVAATPAALSMTAARHAAAEEHARHGIGELSRQTCHSEPAVFWRAKNLCICLFCPLGDLRTAEMLRCAQHDSVHACHDTGCAQHDSDDARSNQKIGEA